MNVLCNDVRTSGHCKNLAPKYEELADAFQNVQDKVIIAKVDADGEGRSLGQQYEVKGFPSELQSRVCVRMSDTSIYHSSPEVVRRGW